MNILRLIFIVFPITFGLLGFGIRFLFSWLSEKIRVRNIMKSAMVPKKIHEEALAYKPDQVHVENADKLKCPTCGAPVRETTFTNARCIYCDTLIPELDMAIAHQIEANRKQMETEMLRNYELKKAYYDYKTDSGRIEESKTRMLVILVLGAFALFIIMMIFATR